jgi:hypothetical protein
MTSSETGNLRRSSLASLPLPPSSSSSSSSTPTSTTTSSSPPPTSTRQSTPSISSSSSSSSSLDASDFANRLAAYLSNHPSMIATIMSSPSTLSTSSSSTTSSFSNGNELESAVFHSSSSTTRLPAPQVGSGSGERVGSGGLGGRVGFESKTPITFPPFISSIPSDPSSLEAEEEEDDTDKVSISMIKQLSKPQAPVLLNMVNRRGGWGAWHRSINWKDKRIYREVSVLIRIIEFALMSGSSITNPSVELAARRVVGLYKVDQDGFEWGIVDALTEYGDGVDIIDPSVLVAAIKFSKLKSTAKQKKKPTPPSSSSSSSSSYSSGYRVGSDKQKKWFGSGGYQQQHQQQYQQHQQQFFYRPTRFMN